MEPSENPGEPWCRTLFSCWGIKGVFPFGVLQRQEEGGTRGGKKRNPLLWFPPHPCQLLFLISASLTRKKKKKQNATEGEKKHPGGGLALGWLSRSALAARARSSDKAMELDGSELPGAWGASACRLARPRRRLLGRMGLRFGLFLWFSGGLAGVLRFQEGFLLGLVGIGSLVGLCVHADVSVSRTSWSTKLRNCDFQEVTLRPIW